MPSWIPAAITGGAQVISGAVNSLFGRGKERRARAWERKMYNQQWKDRIGFWNMQNEYNSPKAQRERLEKAGYNPALMYQSGSAGGQAGSVSPPDVNTPEFVAPNIDFAGAASEYMNQMYNLDIKKQQLDNLQAQNTVMLEDAHLKSTQANQFKAITDRSIFDLEFEKGLADVSAEARRESLRKLQIGNLAMFNQEERNAARHASDLREAAERILTARMQRTKTHQEYLNLKAAIKNIRLDTALKGEDLRLRKMNMYPGDPYWLRFAERTAAGALERTSSTFETFGKSLKQRIGKIDIGLFDWLKSLKNK